MKAFINYTWGPLKVFDTHEAIELEGFYAIAEEGRPPTAYVCNRDDAELYAIAPDLVEALKDCYTDEGATARKQDSPELLVRRLKCINEIVEKTLLKLEKKC